MITTRFAPSPTGYFHAGSYRTALFAWIFAKQNKGKFILRIEDTDRERSKKEYEVNIIESLKWLGLDYDEFYRQSDRTETYSLYIRQLLASGHAYVSSVEDEIHRRLEQQTRVGQGAPSTKKAPIDTDRMPTSVIRFKNPNKKVMFNDLIRGSIEFDTTELGDFVIAKSETEPVFHFVVVVDDHDMGVTHIIRGEDHISNTPRQILIFEALGFELPVYAHIPLLLSTDRSKLSKRKGAIPISEYRSRGYLREAIVNYLALLGWHPSDDKEILSIDEIIRDFSLDRVQKGGAIFSEEKLTWFNRQYILKLNDDDFVEHAKAFLPEWIVPKSSLFMRIIPLLRDKISCFSEVSPLLASTGELGFIGHEFKVVPDKLLWKKNPDALAARTHLQYVLSQWTSIADDLFTAEGIKSAIWAYVEEKGKGDVLWPLRMALTGQDKSPDPFVSAFALGKEQSLERIQTAIDSL
jgi:glutamyl-tRNA synthetase